MTGRVLVIAMLVIALFVTGAVMVSLAQGHWAVLVVPAILGFGLLRERRKARKAGKKA